MRRAPAKPVRACTLRKWCLVSHVTFKAPLRTSHFSLQSSHSTLHTSHSTLHTWDCHLRTPHFTSHWTLKTPHFTLHTSHFSLLSAHSTLHTSQSTLLTSHCFLHTSHFALHTSHCTLHAPHFTLHSSHSTLHLIWALLTLSQLISDATATKSRFWSTFKRTFKRKIASAKIQKICWQITVAALMQPLKYNWRNPAAKDNRITHAAAAPSNLDTAITIRFAASRRKPARIYAHGNTRWQ